MARTPSKLANLPLLQARRGVKFSDDSAEEVRQDLSDWALGNLSPYADTSIFIQAAKQSDSTPSWHWTRSAWVKNLPCLTNRSLRACEDWRAGAAASFRRTALARETQETLSTRRRGPAHLLRKPRQQLDPDRHSTSDTAINSGTPSSFFLSTLKLATDSE